MTFTEFREKTYEQIDLESRYTISEFMQVASDLFYKKYIIKSIITEEQLIILYIDKKTKVLNHVQEYNINQFRKL